MATEITCSIKVELATGMKLSASRKIESVEAYDKISASVPKKAGNTNGKLDVDVQPGNAVQLLFITASEYGSDKLSYDVVGGEADVVLDGPHLFVGAGAVSLMGAQPKKLKFTNKSAEDVAVEIFVGREAS